MLRVFITTAPTFGVRTAKLDANSRSSVFASSQPIIAGATRRTLAQARRILLRMALKIPTLSCTSMIGAKESTMASRTPGTTTSIIPICTTNVVSRISSSSFGSTAAEAPIARRALESAKAQVSATKAAIEAARTSIIQAQTRVDAAQATERRIVADIEDSELKAPRDGRVQYRVAEPGEVLAAGGRVLNMVDLSDVYMTFFLPTEQAGLLKIGGEARLVLDAAPDLRIPATISFVASVAQFTPKTVETSDERLKLMFRVKARIPPELLQQHLEYVKTGLPGMAWVRLNEQLPWPDSLAVRLPQ